MNEIDRVMLQRGNYSIYFAVNFSLTKMKFCDPLAKA